MIMLISSFRDDASVILLDFREGVVLLHLSVLKDLLSWKETFLILLMVLSTPSHRWTFYAEIDEQWLSIGIQFVLIFVMAEITYQLFERDRFCPSNWSAHSPYINGLWKIESSKRHEAVWTRVLTHVCHLYRACRSWICTRENQNSAVQEVEEKIRQNRALTRDANSRANNWKERRLVMKLKRMWNSKQTNTDYLCGWLSVTSVCEQTSWSIPEHLCGWRSRTPVVLQHTTVQSWHSKVKLFKLWYCPWFKRCFLLPKSMHWFKR